MRRLVAAAGAAALVASLFLAWFDPHAGESGWFSYEPLDATGTDVDVVPPSNVPDAVFQLTGWEAFSRLDVVLVLLALATLTRLARFAAPLALTIVVARVLFPVPGLTPAGGAWVALAGAFVATAASTSIARPHLRPLRRAELLAGTGGLLLLAALLLPWFGPIRLPVPVYDPITAWEAFELIPVALLVLAACALAVPVVSGEPAKPIAAAVIAGASGWIAIVLTVYALVSAPEQWPHVRYGLWLALAGAIVAWAGSWLSLRDDSTPGAIARDFPRRPAPS